MPVLSDAVITVGRPGSPEEFDEYYDLRWRILRKPWGQPRGSEKDEFDPTAEHVTARDENGRLLGIGRVHFNNVAEAQIRYMAVEDAARGRGVGRLIVDALEAVARDHGADTIVLDAREHAVPFYERCAYRITGTGPTKFGVIKHATMEKTL